MEEIQADPALVKFFDALTNIKRDLLIHTEDAKHLSECLQIVYNDLDKIFKIKTPKDDAK